MTHADLVRDVTDSLPNTKWQRSWHVFANTDQKSTQKTNKQTNKNCCETCVCVCVCVRHRALVYVCVCSISINTTRIASPFGVLFKLSRLLPGLTNGSLGPDLHDEVVRGGIVGGHQRGPLAKGSLLRSPQDFRGPVVPHHPTLLLELLAPRVPVRIVLDVCNTHRATKGLLFDVSVKLVS